MVLALDPRFPRVWRTPDTLQFGVDAPRLVLHPVSIAEERMIAALADGVSRPGLRMIAKRARAGADAVEALLARLAPVLTAVETPGAAGEPAREAAPLVVVDGDGPTASRLLGLLEEAGIDVRSGLAWTDPAVDSAVYAVIVGSYAIEPERHARWLRRDVAHLPVVFGDRGVTVGPSVVPGAGPCVRCLDLHRRDADPAWPAMAAQLHARGRFGESRLVSDAVSAVVAGVVVAAVRGRSAGRDRTIARDRAGTVRSARSQRFDPARGVWLPRTHLPHPECGCLALPVGPPVSPPAGPRTSARPPGRARPAPPGSGTPAARPDAPAGSPGAPS